MRRSHEAVPELITSARQSSADEFAWRRKKYAIMMSVRVVCFVLAAVTAQFSVALAIAFLVGCAVLPWCAVIIANGGPVKQRAPRPRFEPGYNTEHLLTAGDSRTVDG